MQQYIIRRVLLNFFVLFLVATMVFAALRIDTDSVIRQRAGGCFGGGPGADAQEQIRRCREQAEVELGLDGSVPSQYWEFMSGLVQGDLGDSVVGNKDPVMGEIISRAGPSIELGLLQVFFALLIALPVGIISAVKQDTVIDYLLRFFSILLLGVPVFVIAVLSILISSRYFEGSFIAEWFGPKVGYVTPGENPYENFKIMFAPAIIGGLGTGAIIMRFLRSQMLEVLRQDYVRTAWAKGLKERVVVVRHALKNALIPVLTIVGILLGQIVSGNVILEFIYTIPGIGNYVVFSIVQAPNFPAVQGVVIVVAAVLVFVNLLIDIAYGWLDPRIRYS
ncbi:MAG TPA: ABC transporter permease [Dehalococcoidia bacterium]|nr:ABC transporter permease [Dehalococcoidia bacterium]